jgi:nucleotide-binding universal stress UspA family protein
MVLAVDGPASAGPLVAQTPMAETQDIEASPNHDRERIAKLRTTFDAWASCIRQDDTAVQWNEAHGAESNIIEERGRRADFIVIAQPTPSDDAATRHEFHAALFRTERPLLVVPNVSHKRFGRCVAIAWRDDSRTAKALIPALRVLAGAERVHLMVGVREGATVPAAPAVLQEHGITANLHVLPIGQQPFGKALLEKQHKLSADMLVMGAYVHAPLWRMIFGGVTKYVLDHVDVPVLMRY